MKRFKWKFLSIILFILISYACCENSSPIRQLEPVNKLSSLKPSTNTNLHLKHLDTSEEDETSGDTNKADNDDEDEEDANLDDDEYNGENQDNANDKDEKLDSNTKDDTEDDAEEGGDDEDASPVNLSASNLKDKTPLGTFGNNKNEKVDKSESSVGGGFGSGAAGEDDEEEPDETEGDEKETDDEKELPLDKSKEVTKEELNKNIFNRDKKHPPLEPSTNNQNNNNLNDKNKSTITDDDDEEADKDEKDEDEPVHLEDNKNKHVLTDNLDTKDKSKEIGTNSILNPVHQDVNLSKSRESNENELEMNNLEGSVSLLGKKDVSKGQISLFAQPLILAVVIGSAVAGLLISIVLVMIILYRLSATTDDNYYC